MPFRLDKIFKPITANSPYSNSYIELVPCNALKPYIRCFWISKGEFAVENNLVIPDVCMDIILSFDGDKICNSFCGIDDRAFVSGQDRNFKFGIRFYAWSAAIFSDNLMNNALNSFSDTREYFSDFNDYICEEIITSKDIYKMKSVAERYLILKLNDNKININIMNSIYNIITCSGNIRVNDLADSCVISIRQLERKFLEHTGVTPKKMINLIRYQLLWQESLKICFNVPDSIDKFGFYDQSHLLNEFKKYHSAPLNKARENYFMMSHFSNTD